MSVWRSFWVVSRTWVYWEPSSQLISIDFPSSERPTTIRSFLKSAILVVIAVSRSTTSLIKSDSYCLISVKGSC